MSTVLPERYNASLLIDGNLEASRSEKVAIHCEGERVTYGELASRINRLGNSLLDLGIEQEDRVLMVLNDTPAFPVTFFAAMRIGAVPIPTNTLLGSEDYRFFVENSRAKAIVLDSQHYEKVVGGLRESSESPVMVLADGNAEGCLSLTDLVEVGGEELSPADTHRDDPAFWLYSSGSTGRPKATVHLQHDIDYTTRARPTPGTCCGSPKTITCSRRPSSSTPTGWVTASPSHTGPEPLPCSNPASRPRRRSWRPRRRRGRRSSSACRRCTTRSSTTPARESMTSPP